MPIIKIYEDQPNEYYIYVRRTTECTFCNKKLVYRMVDTDGTNLVERLVCPEGH